MSMDEIIKYVTQIGGPVAVIGSAIFFLLRNYIAKRIEADFSERVEAFKHVNSTEIERLRANFTAKLEELRATLSVSQAAATLLLQKRIGAYEEIFSRIHTLRNALNSLQVSASSAKYESARQERVAEFLNASSELDRCAAKVVPFISPRVEQQLTKLILALGNHGINFFEGQSKLASDEWRPFLEMQNNLEGLIRDDLCSVLSDGKLTYPEMHLAEGA